MTVEDAMKHLDEVLAHEPLNTLQEEIFRQAWQGKTYEQIATLNDYDTDYIRHLGQQLWQRLSRQMAQRVTKRNLQVVFRRHSQHYQSPVQLVIQSQYGNSHWDRSSQNRYGLVSTTPTIQLVNHSSINLPNCLERYGSFRTLQQWVEHDRAKLIAILGMGGIGKTTLARQFVQKVQDHFEVVLWRSLRNAPPFSTFIETLLKGFPRQSHESLPATPDAQIALLLNTFQEYRSLLVLDNFESVLQPQALGGQYHPDHQAYGHLLRIIADEAHQSCILLTSREHPVGLTLREDHQSYVRSHQVPGLAIADAQQLLLRQDLAISEKISEQLVKNYGGNPFALKTLASTIRSLFGGDISQFIEQTHLVYGDIKRLLAQQIQRLTPPELQIIKCIAGQSDWFLLDRLQDAIAQEHQLSPSTIWEAILSLQGRSLIQSSAQGFNLHPYLRQYLLSPT